MLTAQQYPDKVHKLILYGFPLDTRVHIETLGSQTQSPRQATTALTAAEDFILAGTISKQAVDS